MARNSFSAKLPRLSYNITRTIVYSTSCCIPSHGSDPDNCVGCGGVCTVFSALELLFFGISMLGPKGITWLSKSQLCLVRAFPDHEILAVTSVISFSIAVLAASWNFVLWVPQNTWSRGSDAADMFRLTHSNISSFQSIGCQVKTHFVSFVVFAVVWTGEWCLDPLLTYTN